MGIGGADVDGDGRLDLFVTHFQGEMDSLYLNKSPEGFEESAVSSGLGAVSLPYTKWGTAFFDVDHDGDLDLAIVNGRVKRAEPATQSGWQSYAEPNQLFLNDGTGHFVEHVSKAETFCNRHGIYRGLAVG